MDNGDVAATLISSLALLVSGWTLYLTYFRHKAALVGSLAAVFEPTSNPDAFDKYIFEFALSNTGTLELLIREVLLDVIGGKGELVPEVKAGPFVLRPGEVKLLAVEIPARFIGSMSQARRTLAVEFHVFSSRGVPFRPKKMLALQNEPDLLPNNAWAPFSLGPKDN